MYNSYGTLLTYCQANHGITNASNLVFDRFKINFPFTVGNAES